MDKPHNFANHNSQKVFVIFSSPKYKNFHLLLKACSNWIPALIFLKWNRSIYYWQNYFYFFIVQCSLTTSANKFANNICFSSTSGIWFFLCWAEECPRRQIFINSYSFYIWKGMPFYIWVRGRQENGRIKLLLKYSLL